MAKLAKSKVQIIRSNCDWGAILYSACYVFNRNLAQHWLAFVREHSSEENAGTEKIEHEIKRLSAERDEILQKNRLQKQRMESVSKSAAKSKSRYIMSKPIGDFVDGWKKYRKAQIKTDLVGMLDNMASEEQHRIAMLERNESLKEYVQAMDLRAGEEREDDRTCLRKAHHLLNKIASLKKSLGERKTPLVRPISEDRDDVYRFLSSEMQAERLMGVCLNILKAYSGSDFFVRFSDCDRELTANYIYDAFSSFSQNYDFLCGCYEKLEDGKLHLKSLDTLEKKFYNGYYLTIRGFVQKAYVHARREAMCMSSLDSDGDGDDDRNGYDRMGDVAESLPNSSESLIDEGMVRYWKDCRDFFFMKKSDMEDEFIHLAESEFGTLECPVNRNDVSDFFIGVISGLDRELSAGRVVRSKFRHIILDAMSGARNVEEWNSQTRIVQGIIKKYLSLFFANENGFDASKMDEMITWAD